MALRSLLRSIPLKKVIIFLGFVSSALIGIISASICTSYFTFPFLVSLCAYLLFSFFGAFIGLSVYLQSLKIFKIWPMEQCSTLIFSPHPLFNEVIFALRAFDWELLKFTSQIALYCASPQFSAYLNAPLDPQEDETWLSAFIDRTKRRSQEVTRTLHEEVVFPVAFRKGLSYFIHKKYYELLNYQHLHAMPPPLREQHIQGAVLRYQGGLFLRSLSSSQKGFFESIGSTCIDVYQNTPRINTQIR